jgi:membrane-associated phospholipid phosphatase
MKIILSSRKTCWSVAALFMIMMVIGSFFDYPISCSLYDASNWFGILFAAFGEYPSTLGLIVVGSMLLAGRDKEHRSSAAFQCVGGILLTTLGTALSIVLPSLYVKLPFYYPLCVGMICSAIVFFGTFHLCRGAERSNVIRVALAILVTIIATTLIVNMIKIPWGRARMRLVASDARAYFMPWWQIGDGLKSSLIATGIGADEFKSFPSGHVAAASAMMLLCLIPQIQPKLASMQSLLFAIGFGWTCLAALSRIIIGAHYLTDVTVAFAIGFLVMNIVCRRMFPEYSHVPVSKRD